MLEKSQAKFQGVQSLTGFIVQFLGDEAAQAAVRAAQVITLDGCKLACASANVRQAGGTVARAYDVLDFYRRHKEFKPQGIAELNEGGLQLAEAMADEISQVVDQLKTSGQRSPVNGRLSEPPNG